MKYLRVILIVLLLGCCSLWVVSYWEFQWSSRDDRNVVLLWDGNFMIGRHEFGNANVYHTLILLRYIGGQSSHWWPVLRVDNYPGFWAFHGTFWLPTLLLALPVAIMESPWARRRRRAKQGLCIRCGYDLSGIDHTLCPECGTEVAKA